MKNHKGFYSMNKLLAVGILGLLLFSVMFGGYSYLENEHLEEINKERSDYNNLLRKFVKENQYKLGDNLIPIKLMRV